MKWFDSFILIRYKVTNTRDNLSKIAVLCEGQEDRFDISEVRQQTSWS
ncbi:MAG: hypothetical protein RBS82_12750 [Syntrophales bacterium]|nr:hypothetical protein [Syntrophales bacterium]